MPWVHHNIVRKLLPRVQVLRLHDIGPITYKRLPIPLLLQLLQPRVLLPVHVTRILVPRVAPRVEQHPKRAGIPTLHQRSFGAPITRLWRRTRSTQELLHGTLSPAPILACLTTTPGLGKRIPDQLHRLRLRVIYKLHRCLLTDTHLRLPIL